MTEIAERQQLNHCSGISFILEACEEIILLRNRMIEGNRHALINYDKHRRDVASYAVIRI